MKSFLKQLAAFLILSFLIVQGLGYVKAAYGQDMYKETRYCGEPKRGSQGEILRDRKAIIKFREVHPCPSTGRRTGACNGWAIDHVIPLACGGCDAVSNMQWLPDSMKNYSGTLPKDRWERKVYAKPEIYDGHSCKFEVLK